jgi:Tfp pilus assembly protein PilN
MLTINLLPRKRPRPSALAQMDVRAALMALVASVRDPLLIGAVASVLLMAGIVGLLYVRQQARFEDVTAQVDRAVRDSTRYSNVLAARRRVSAERDSVTQQLAIIRAIDNTRYQWAHVLDEVSRALPSFTWLIALEQTSTPPLPPTSDSAKVTPADSAAGAQAVSTPPPVRFRLVGQTIDIQALTLFMRQLESSPFIQAVTLTRSEIVIVDGKEVTQFELGAESESPPPGELRTAPLVIPVR